MTRPLGVFSPPGGAPRVGARDGERVLDIAAVGPAVLAAPKDQVRQELAEPVTV